MRRADLVGVLLTVTGLAGCEHGPAVRGDASGLSLQSTQSAHVTSAMVFPARDQRPVSQSSTAFNLPTVVERQLGNGMRVLMVQQRDAPVVSLRLLVKRGASDVPPGLAEVAVNTFFRRVKGIPGTFAQVSAGYDALAIDATGVTRWSQGSNLPDDSFNALARMVRTIEVPDALLETARQELLERTTDREHDLDSTAARLWHSLLYPSQHPYHFDVHGDRASISAVTRAGVEQFFREQVQPDQVTLVAVGDIAIESFVISVKAAFGGWQGKALARRALPEPIAAAASGPAVSLVNATSLSEAAITVGARGVAWNNPDFHALVLLNTLLGGSFQSRLNMNLRERMAYAYSPFSTFGVWRGSGPFLVCGKVDPDDAADAVARIASEVARVRNEPLSDQELTQLKALATRRIPLLFATLADTLTAVSQLAINDQPIGTYAHWIGDIARVTPADLQRVARTYLAPEQLRWVVIGPAERVKAPLERLQLGAVALVTNP